MFLNSSLDQPRLTYRAEFEENRDAFDPSCQPHKCPPTDPGHPEFGLLRGHGSLREHAVKFVLEETLSAVTSARLHQARAFTKHEFVI
ncbi:hypothetical protein DTW90_28450 [Neorhizobium sp. P12A]|nr:hypothetical protein DTW90_28450 [Neorhizobium sp. P12A]